MPTPCDRCQLLFCDYVSRDCRLSPAEVARLRPDLLKPPPKPQRFNLTGLRRHRANERLKKDILAVLKKLKESKRQREYYRAKKARKNENTAEHRPNCSRAVQGLSG